jgi:hypothetical protein
MSSALGLKVFGYGLLAWIGWRVFGPLHPTWVALWWSGVVCFAAPLIAVFLWPDIAFALGQRVMRLYNERKHWLIMRDLPLASKSAWRSVRDEQRWRKRHA